MRSVRSVIGGRIALALTSACLSAVLPGCGTVIPPGGGFYMEGTMWDSEASYYKWKSEQDEERATAAAVAAFVASHPCVAPPPGQPSDAPMALTGTRTVNFFDGRVGTWKAVAFGDVGALSDTEEAAVGNQGIAVTAMACPFRILSGQTTGTQPEQVVGTNLGLVHVSPEDGTVGIYTGLPLGAFVTSLLPHDDGSGTFLVGLRGNATLRPLWSCQMATHACADVSAGLPSAVTQVNDLATAGSSTTGSVDVVATDSGAYRSQAGNVQPVAGLESATVKEVVVMGTRIHYGTKAGPYSGTIDASSATIDSDLPAEPVTALAGGGSLLTFNFQTSGFYFSSDQGTTFTPHPGPAGSSTISSMVIFQNSVVASTDVGLFRTMDGGMTWTTFGTGFVGGVVNQYAVGMNASFMAAPSGLFGSTGGGPWALLDPGPANVVLTQGNNVFAMGGKAIHSVDLGLSFRHDVTGLPSGPPSSAASNATTFFVTFPYAGLFKSFDGGATWSPVPIGSMPTYPATTVAASGNVVVVGASTGGVAGSTDGGLTFVPWTATGSAPVISAAIHGSDVFVGLGGGGSTAVLKSSDSGRTWTPAGSGLPMTPVLSLAGTTTSPSFARRAEAAGGGTLFAGTAGGLYMSADGGASWTLAAKGLFGTAVTTLSAAADRLFVGTSGLGGQAFVLPLSVTLIVPVVLDVASGAAHFTSELSLTNRGATPVSVSLTYTASLGTGSGTVDDALAAGQQLVIPDVIAYLRNKGLAIPGSQAGTLVVTFVGAEAPDVVAATARTTALTAAPQPIGNAGLAYSGVSPAIGTTGRLIVYGLRTNSTDRSNLAVYNTTTDPVTVKVTAYSGDGSGASVVIAASDTVGPYGWKQYNGILATAGFANGYVAVERVSAAGAFSAYGVVNDNGTNDGSFLLPHVLGGLLPYLNVPVLVETSSFLSELVLANSGSTTAHLTLTYAESLDAAGGGGTVAVDLPAGTQQIIPNAIAYLRAHGVTIGPPGRSYAGALHVAEYGASVGDLYAGARTASQSPAGGQFGLFTPAFYPGTEGAGSAYLYGLRADANNRSNVAVINTGLAAAGSITLRLQAYDGGAGGIARGDPTDVVLAPGAWKQLNGFLGSKGASNGWVKITLISGGAPWIAYGVINDGGAPGQRTSDGAYVPMSR